MKITYLYQYFNTPDMAGGSRAYEMGKRLVDAGHEVNMITSIRSHPTHTGWKVTNENGINVHWYPVPYSNSMPFSQRIRQFFRFAFAASLRAASLPADIIFATSTPLTIALPAVYGAWRNAIPMVFEVRDLWPEIPIAVGAIRNPVAIKLARSLELFAYRNAKHIVALSPGMAAGIRNRGIPAERISIIPNSCDLDSFLVDSSVGLNFRRKHPELGNGPIVLYAGTLGRINEVDYLVYLARDLYPLRPDARFVVIGDGSEAKRISELASVTGVLGLNYFQYPLIPKREVVEAFSAATISTSVIANIPELENNSANKFFDSLAAGKPVAINHGGWQADLINETNAGIVLNRDTKQAATQLANFLSKPDELEKAAIAAKAIAKGRFARDILALQLKDLLEKTVAEAGKK